MDAIVVEVLPAATWMLPGWVIWGSPRHSVSCGMGYHQQLQGKRDQEWARTWALSIKILDPNRAVVARGGVAGGGGGGADTNQGGGRTHNISEFIFPLLC